MCPVELPTEFPVELPSRGHCYQGDFLHIFKLLPGITLSVLKQHILESLHFQSCSLPPQVAPHPKPSGFVITLHSSHPAALCIACEEIKVRRAMKAKPGDQLSYSLAFETHSVIEQALQGIYRRQARTSSRWDPGAPSPIVKPSPVPTKATPKATTSAPPRSPLTSYFRSIRTQHRKPKCPQSPPTTNWLTLQDFFQCLWNLPTATPQVSLPGILWPLALLSALSQYLWLKIQPSTHRSSPRSTVSYGLRWQLALHAKAMATAWDLISQTHLELWGQLQDGILTMA